MNLSFKTISYIFFSVVMVFACAGLSAQNISSIQTMESMVLANKYFVENHANITKTKISGWTTSIYFEGLLAMYSVNPDSSYLKSIMDWAEFNFWGLPLGTSSRNTENQSIGQVYIDLYTMNRYKEERIRNIRACIDNMLKTEIVDDWVRVEDLQIAMPIFARLGKIYNNEEYFDRMNKMFLYAKQQEGGTGLYSPTDRLWWHDKDYVTPFKEPNGEGCYWSRGNGLAISALVRTLQFLPKNNDYRKDYLKILIEILETLSPLQRTDGFWNVSLKDPGNFGGKELTGTALIVYGLAWAINEGELSKKEYLPVVMKAWTGIIKEALNPDGSLGYVQGAGSGPKDGQPVGLDTKSGSDDLAVGCFLFAGSEVYKLAKSIEPKEKEPKKEKESKSIKVEKDSKVKKGKESEGQLE
jgi:unsaturated rhamnogalacturonyl hydrolase